MKSHRLSYYNGNQPNVNYNENIKYIYQAGLRVRKENDCRANFSESKVETEHSKLNYFVISKRILNVIKSRCYEKEEQPPKTTHSLISVEILSVSTVPKDFLWCL